MKQIVKFRLYTLLLLLSLGGLSQAADNLIRNPGMEEGIVNEITGEHEVSGWRFQSFTGKPVILKRVQEGSYAGDWHVTLESDHDDDIRLVQIIKVAPDTIYKVSAWVKTKNVRGNRKGANLALLDYFQTSADLTGTHTEWTPLYFYLRTARDTSQIQLSLSVGGFGSMNKGKVSFDEVRIVKLEAAPRGETVLQVQLKPENLPQIGSKQQAEPPSEPLFNKEKPPLMVVAALISIAILISLLLLISLPDFRKRKPVLLTKKNLDRFFPKQASPAGEPVSLPVANNKIASLLKAGKYLKLLPIAAVAFILIWNLAYSVGHDPEMANESRFLHQAIFFLDGKIEAPTAKQGTIMHEEKHYLVAPLLPSLLVLPFVFFFGLKTKITFIALIITLGSLLVLYRLLKKLDIPDAYLPWLLTAFFVGTGYFFCLSRGYQTILFSHTCATLFILLALNEVLGKCRGFLCGLFLGLAFLCREVTLLSALFCVFAILDKYKQHKIRNLQLGAMTGGIISCLVLYAGYNWLRFGDPMNTGLGQLLAQSQTGETEVNGLFSPAYLPLNFHALFLQGLNLQFTGLKVTGLGTTGTSLLFASPFILFALLAKWKTRLKLSAWMVIGLLLLGQLMYHSTGAPQWNTQRFTLDFMPLLFILTALGIKEVRTIYWKGAILYALALNALALWVALPPLARHIFS